MALDDLEAKLNDLTLDHETRADIGQQLNAMGDTRPGVGLRPDGLPDIAWCAVDVPTELRGVKQAFKNERGEIYGEYDLGGPFFIARYPVTYAQFGAFVDAPDGWTDARWWDGMTPQYQRQPIFPQRTQLDNHPREAVSWYQAVAFGRWLNAKCAGEQVGSLVIGHDLEIRLPLEWEWQYAAQGADGRTYPWGDVWDGRFANTREARLGVTTAVGMVPQGASWCGALDMSGGLWEWCLNEYKTPDQVSFDSYVSRILRGGSFVDIPEYAVCGSRFNDLPNRRLDYYGFRVACVPVGL